MRTDIVKLIHEESPDRPACFETHAEWTRWLVSAHEAGQKVVRRSDTGKHAGHRVTSFKVLPVGQQSHCVECSQARRSTMRAAGRCFPVNPPANEKPQPEPVAGIKRARFEVGGVAKLKKVKADKRGPEDKRYLVLTLDVEFARVEAAVCAYFDALLVAFLYRQELGNRVVRNESLRPISYTQQITDASVEIDRQAFHNADVSHFVITPIDGAAVSLSCRIAIYPGKANCNDLICRVKEGVRMRIVGPDDLFDDSPEPSKPQAQAALI